jgi:uncharacterized protein (DUF1499 family)
MRKTKKEGVSPENSVNKDLAVPSASNPSQFQSDQFFRDLKRPKSPNNYLIAPKEFPGNPDELSPFFSAGAERLKAVFEETVGALPGLREEGRDGPISHFVDETPLCHFKDDIYVQFIDLGDGRSTLAAYSASRIGFWDLGKNRRRLKEWLALVLKRLGL